MLLGETIRNGAPKTCTTCNKTPRLQVCRSAAGYYIGTYCDCGPYTCESEYYKTKDAAEFDLKNDTVRWRS